MSDEVNKVKGQIAAEDVPIFLNAQEKLICFHKEVAKLSNKKPDGPLSKFKLGFINQVLEPLNRILGDDYRPFPDFTTFDVDGSMPTASDALMMMSQYETAMKNFQAAHTITVTKPERREFSSEHVKTREWNTGQPADQTLKPAHGGDDLEDEEFDEGDLEDEELEEGEEDSEDEDEE